MDAVQSGPGSNLDGPERIPMAPTTLAVTRRDPTSEAIAAHTFIGLECYTGLVYDGDAHCCGLHDLTVPPFTMWHQPN